MTEKNCLICYENINDPVCMYCYMNQVRLCLMDQQLNSTIINYINNKIKNKYIIESINDIECLICKNESVNICFYCFSKIIINVLTELNFSESLIENFSEFFHYNLSEYDTLDAEKIGYKKNIFHEMKGGAE